MSKIDVRLIKPSDFIDLTNEEMDFFYEKVRVAQSIRKANAVSSFQLGNKVRFAGRRGTQLTGTVMKINRTTVIVNVDGLNWRVSPGLLTKI